MRMCSHPGRRRALVLAGALLATAAAKAQDAAPAEPAPAPGPAAPAATPPAPAPAPAALGEPAQLDRVEVTAPRPDDTAERRQSTASKIVVGRDEIERFGDSTVGELLKRLPGVTIQGPPGRGGAIRMRGLGSGYTQVLLDGERVPPGFSLDSLAPEQIERIEILRAPTAETGTRAIAGTINIVTREGFTKRINDLKLGVALENDKLSPELSWTHNDAAGPVIYNLSLTAYDRQRDTETDIVTVNQALASGATTLAQNEQISRQERRDGLSLSGRLQWRGEPGESLTLIPFVVLNQGHSQTEALMTQSVGALPPPYASAAAEGDSRYSQVRLGGQWNRRLADTMRMEVRGGLGQGRFSGQSQRNEFDADGGLPRVIEDDGDIRDRSFNVTGKLFALMDGDHSIVSGAEFEGTRRAEYRLTLQNGEPQLAEYGDNFDAATSRVALYAQDEWNATPQWAAHAGLRWEGIVTTGDQADGSPLRNVSTVWSPIVHAVWRPEPSSRDQVRFSVTRSYRTPTLQNLIARPSISVRYPTPGTNLPSAPDREGNPDLLPELATGLDIAFERYPATGGVLIANVFMRRIDNLIRSVTTLQDVPWSPGVPRWVSQPQNIGSAAMQGLELEAKFRLTDIWPEAWPVDVRANAGLFHSSVASVPGPDNRLDQQPRATANLGADYRLRSLPLTLGANVNWNPAYTTRLAEDQTVYQGRKLVVDANALWVFRPGVQLRLTATNLAPADYLTGSTFETELERETAQTTTRSDVNWLLRLELKL